MRTLLANWLVCAAFASIVLGAIGVFKPQRFTHPKTGKTPHRALCGVIGFGAFVVLTALIGFVAPANPSPSSTNESLETAAAAETTPQAAPQALLSPPPTESAPVVETKPASMSDLETTATVVSVDANDATDPPAPMAAEYDISCKVVGIADGDSLTCLTDDRKQLKVRLNQIDAPEKKQAFGNAARKALSAYVFGKVVGLKTNGKDKYGRTLAEVFVRDLNVNKAMVADGFAWAYREHLTDSEYSRMEEAARSKSLGLWSQPNPVYPSEFRHQERAPVVTNQVKPAPAASSGLAARGKFTCSGKRFCREMNSCAEARFYLNECGVGRLDRDNDGIPCESLC